MHGLSTAPISPTAQTATGPDADTAWAWSVELIDGDGRSLGSSDVEPSWESAFEWAHWQAVRAGLVQPLMGDPGGSVEPVWGPDGAPCVSAVRVRVGGDPGVCASAHRLSADSAFFRALAQYASGVQRDRGELEGGQRHSHRLMARRIPGRGATAVRDADPECDARWGLETVSEPLPIRSASLAPRVAAATLRGPDARADDLRVFIAESVLAGAAAAAREAGNVEVGGALLGHVSRDAQQVTPFVDITAEVPARHTEATRSSLTFTANTWAAIGAAAAHRGRGEQVIGWWHLHPDFAGGACRACPPERRRACPLSNAFFSGTDVHMHRAVFPRAFQTALLLSDLGQPELDVGFYGWHEGVIAARGFEVVPDGVLA